MVQLLKSEVDGLLKGRQARNQAIGPFPEVDMRYFDVAEPTFDLVDCKTGASPVVKEGSGDGSPIRLFPVEKAVDDSVWDSGESGKLAETCSKVETGEYDLAA